MKPTWEYLIPLMITVAGGLIVWTVKIAINAIGKSITRELREKVERLEAEKEAMEKDINRNTSRIDFLWEKLIERNS